MGRRISTAFAASLAVACFAPAGASAVTETIGSPLTNPYQGGVCTNSCLSTQQTAGTIASSLVAPGNGTITNWKVRTSDDAALYQLLILRPIPAPPAFLAAGRVTAPTAVPAGTTDEILTYPGNSLPIRAGDHIGIYQTGNADDGLPQFNSSGITTNVIDNFFAGNTLADNGTATFTPDFQHELLLQATGEFCKVPDVKGKKTKAARTAIEAGGCTVEVKKKTAKKRKKVGKVTKQEPAAGGGAKDGSNTVVLTVGKKQK
jgi:hypothetical protein